MLCSMEGVIILFPLHYANGSSVNAASLICSASANVAVSYPTGSIVSNWATHTICNKQINVLLHKQRTF